MSDILSQEEIDRLLNATASEPANEVADLSPSEVAAAEKVTRALFDSANSVLAALLTRPASVARGLGQQVDVAALDTAKGFLVRLPFQSGFSGELVLFMGHQEASMLADLILGGEGTPKDTLDEADLDALKEAMTQVAAESAPAMSASLGVEVAFGASQEEEIEQGELPAALPWDQAFSNAATIEVDGALKAPLRVLLSTGVAREMADLAGQTGICAESQPLQTIPTGGQPAKLEPTAGPPPDIRNIDLILDIEVDVMVRLGKAVMPIKDIQRLRPGSIIDLDKDIETPIELVVNDKAIAKGELVVVGSDHFALRITEIETPTERIRRLGP